MKKDLHPFNVAYTYWKVLKPGQREWRNVAKDLGIRLQGSRDADIRILNKLGRLARRWEEKGLVQHIVLREDSEAAGRPERIPELEEQLRSHFPLRHAVVVDTSSIDEQSEYKHDDEVHKLLGKWGGRILNVCLRGTEDVVGTGGGRGPYYTVRNCQFNRRVNYPRKVMSLTGRISAMDWRPNPEAFLDADRVAGEMANILAIREVVRLGADIVPGEDLPKPQIPIHEVTFAITGVGALAGGHRLLNHEQFPELDPVRDELSELMERLRKFEGKPGKGGKEMPHHWVGDLCNWLFICEPDGLPRHVTKAELQKLKDLVKRLNARFLNPSLDDMRDICRRGGVLAVCGGRHKVNAIRHLLRLEAPVISHLVTDRWSAENILRLQGEKI